MYSFQNLKTANEILCDLETAARLFPEHITWANDVKNFFDRLYDYARRCTGHWCCRIKLAWQFMTRKVKKLSKYLKNLGGLLKNGVLYLSDNEKVRRGGVMKVRKARHFVRN